MLLLIVSIETTAYKPVKLEASCTVMLLPVVSLYDPRCKDIVKMAICLYY